MTSSSGFSVRIFMPSGEPEGPRVVEKSNWSGQGLVFPRSLYGAERKRPELTRTGGFNSPSTAAGVLLGCSLKELQEAEVGTG